MMPSRCAIGEIATAGDQKEETVPLRKGKNKNSQISATFFRLGTPFRPCKAKIGRFMANSPRFHAPIRDLEPRDNP